MVEDQDSSKVAEVVFEPYYSLAPNQLKDTIKITVLRPKTRGTYTVGITVDTEGKGAFFDKGVVEKSILRLDIKDVYEQPEGWDERQEWLGEFDEEKYAFMVTVSKQAFSKENNHMWNETDKYNLELREALDEFNANAAPEDRKKFKFPVTTKLVWWDKQLKFLGEFSEEKHEFIKNLLSEEGETLANNSKLEYWNLVFRDAVAEQGISEFSFPVVTSRPGGVSPCWELSRPRNRNSLSANFSRAVIIKSKTAPGIMPIRCCGCCWNNTMQNIRKLRLPLIFR